MNKKAQISNSSFFPTAGDVSLQKDPEDDGIGGTN